ncbi:MAG: hypothetical protein Q8O40_02400 [Chloroflexota bacterium]|nr:hypothetical protein [Chloroflexota bacterium]
METNISVPLLVDQVMDTGFPKDLPVGTQVCALGEYTYASEVKRYRFLAWRSGATEFRDRCVTLALEKQTYTALFQDEALVQVTSVIPEVSTYQWAVVGSTVDLRAPDVVSAGDNKRWRFAGWTTGLTPSSTTNQIVVAKAVTVEARYTAEFQVQVSAPSGVAASGGGWYASGQLATVRTADMVSQEEGKRLQFRRWEVDGVPQGSLQLNLPVLTFTVSSPATFRSQHSQEYLVTASTPQGTILQGWYGADSLLTIETAASLEGLRFVRWKESGGSDNLAQTSRLQLVVNRPLQLQAVYAPAAAPPTAGPPSVATLNENAPIPLLVDGVEKKDLPATLSPGSRACVSSSLTYTGEGERHRFVGWSSGSSELCQTLLAGITVAFFEKQVLLRISSSVKSVAASKWVPADTVVDLDAPAVVEEGGARWTFESWSVGEQPLSRATHLPMLKPQNVEARYTAEYLVQLDSLLDGVALMGGGWYQANTTAVIRAPLYEEQGADRRLKFVEWQQVGQRPLAIAGLQQQELSIPVSGPLTLRPRYVQEYLVETQNPQGVLLLTWMEKGKTLEVETPAVIDIVEGEERQRFSHWQEQVKEAVPLAQLPKLSIPVDRPVRLEAVYRREFKVTLAAPYGGSGTGWYAENSTAILSVPPQPQAVLFLKKVFQGYAGYPDTGPVLQVVVQGPMSVGAIYKNEVDFRVLIFVVAGLLGAFLIWRLTERRTGPPQAAAEPAEQPIEEEIIEEIVEEDEDAHPPISTRWRQPPRDDAR